MKKPMRKYKIEQEKKNTSIFLKNGSFSKDGKFSTIYSNYTQAEKRSEKLKLLGYNCEVLQEKSSRRFIIKKI